MYKRLNITLAEDVLARADAFAARERYTRSGLIAAALDAFTADDARATPGSTPAEQEPGSAWLAREEASVTYAPRAAQGAITLEAVSNALRAFFSARDDVEAAWVFGSVARGTAGPMSDVDVAVLPRQRLDKAGRGKLRLDLMSRLPVALRVPEVDVAVLPDVSVTLAHRALVEGKRVHGARSVKATEAEIAAMREYVDFEPVRSALSARLSERLRGHGTGR